MTNRSIRTVQSKPTRSRRSRATYVVIGACLVVGAGFVAARAALNNTEPSYKIYKAERVYLPCELSPGDQFGTMTVAIGNDSGRAVPQGWPVQYQLVDDRRAPRYSVKFAEGVADKAHLRQRVSAAGLRAGPCVAWTILKKEPLQLIDPPR